MGPWPDIPVFGREHQHATRDASFGPRCESEEHRGDPRSHVDALALLDGPAALRRRRDVGRRVRRRGPVSFGNGDGRVHGVLRGRVLVFPKGGLCHFLRLGERRARAVELF